MVDENSNESDNLDQKLTNAMDNTSNEATESIKLRETMEELDKLDTDNISFFNLDNEMHLAKVIKCYDGDTIHCIFKHDSRYQKFSVRMNGYDTAEMRPSRKLPEDVRMEEKRKAKLAKKRLQELILNKNIYLECLKFDKYGRLLANVRINKDDPESVNDLMIREGYGKEYFGGKK
jgi:endonuclease YncB( thermonuclease family)